MSASDLRELQEYLDCLGFEAAPFLKSGEQQLIPQVQSTEAPKAATEASTEVSTEATTQASAQTSSMAIPARVPSDHCTACSRSIERDALKTATLWGQGSATARLFFVCEGPTQDELKMGRFLTGEAGELFDKMLSAMGESRSSIYLTAAVKCPSKELRYPNLEELSACAPHLKCEILKIKPQVLVTLGRVATKALLGEELKFESIRGQFRKAAHEDLPDLTVLPTFLPQQLLRDPELKKAAWEDLKKVMSFLK